MTTSLVDGPTLETLTEVGRSVHHLGGLPRLDRSLQALLDPKRPPASLPGIVESLNCRCIAEKVGAPVFECMRRLGSKIFDLRTLVEAVDRPSFPSRVCSPSYFRGHVALA
jgi:hypothetical protein